MHSLPLPGNDFPPSENVVQSVDELMHWTDFSVDVIPPSWDLELTFFKSGVRQIDYEAQRVLAFLLNWYSSRYGRPRFSGLAVNLSYKLLMTRFQIAGEKRVIALLDRMENTHGVIHRHSRGLGKGKGAVLCLAPNMDRVEAITYPVLMDTKTGELRRWRIGDPVSGGPYCINTMRRHEAEATGVLSYEDESTVHILSVRKRLPGESDDAVLTADPETDDTAHRHRTCASVIGDTSSDVGTLGAPVDRSDARVRPAVDTANLAGPVRPAGPDTPHGVGQDLPHAARTEHSSPSTTEVVSHADAASPPGTAADRPLPGHRGRTTANAPARTYDDDLRLVRQLDIFRWLFEAMLKRTTGANARRSVVRTAWQAAMRLLPGEIDSDWIYNAWRRLERAGSADPALDLLGVAVLACGRCTGTVIERARIAADVLGAVSRQGVTDAIDPAVPQDEVVVDRALRSAFQHHLDRFSLPRLVVRVCQLGSKDSRTHAFVNGLVRLYETHEIPFSAALFAGALAAVVRDHRNLTAVDLLDACEIESQLHPFSRVTSGDKVLLGTWSLATDRFVSHESVVDLGTPPSQGHDSDAWDTVEEIRVLRGRAVAVTRGGSVVSLDRADVERQGYDNVHWLASRACRG